MARIDKDIEIEDLVSGFPETLHFLTEKGIICIQCGAPVWGTLGETIERAGFDPDEIVNALNAILETK